MNVAGQVWKARRAPVTVLASLTALVAVAALGVELGADARELPGAGRVEGWWRSLTERLPLFQEPGLWLVVGAGVAVAGGLWLFLLAVTPGRRWLPMASQHAGTHAELDRHGVALLLRDTALAVPGVSTATVRPRRRGFSVRASAAFGDLERVDAQLTGALDATVDVLGVRGRPRLVVRLRPSGEWVPPLVGRRDQDAPIPVATARLDEE